MRGLIAAIRNVLRAMQKAAARWTEKWVEIGGRLVRTLVPSGAPIEPDEPEVVEAARGEFENDLRTVAGQLIAGGVPNPDRLAELPPHIARWLTVLDDSMLRSVIRASDDELQAHLRGSKALRGVVWSDERSVDEWIADQTGRDLDDPELATEMAWRPA